MADIRDHKVDVVVVYKVDRLMSVSRPMLELVLKDCVTDTNDTSAARFMPI